MNTLLPFHLIFLQITQSSLKGQFLSHTHPPSSPYSAKLKPPFSKVSSQTEIVLSRYQQKALPEIKQGAEYSGAWIKSHPYLQQHKILHRHRRYSSMRWTVLFSLCFPTLSFNPVPRKSRKIDNNNLSRSWRHWEWGLGGGIELVEHTWYNIDGGIDGCRDRTRAPEEAKLTSHKIRAIYEPGTWLNF